MARVRFEEMQNMLEEFKKEYVSLFDDFLCTGDFDIFVGLDEKLYRLSSKTDKLTDPEERLEIQSGIDTLKKKIDSLSYSV